MGWKGREITFPLGMLFRKMYCMGCGTRLKRHRVDNLIKKGDPEYNGRILGGATIGMDRKQVSYYVYKCPNCGLMFTYEKQLEIEAKQKQAGTYILPPPEKPDYRM